MGMGHTMAIFQAEQVNTVILLGILKEVVEVGEFGGAAKAHERSAKVFRFDIFPIVFIVQGVGIQGII